MRVPLAICRDLKIHFLGFIYIIEKGAKLNLWGIFDLRKAFFGGVLAIFAALKYFSANFTLFSILFTSF